jgi:hypothetical protein
MYHECRHIMPSGSKCKSPALHESAFCYYHVNLRKSAAPKGTFDSIKLPPLEDSCGLRIALNEVLYAVVHQRIDSKRAGLLLYGLQIAAQLNARRTDVPNPVRELCHDSDGNTLAPEEAAHEAADDCHNCPRGEQCDDRKEEKEEEDHYNARASADQSGSSHSNLDPAEISVELGNPPGHKPCHPELSVVRRSEGSAFVSHSFQRESLSS